MVCLHNSVSVCKPVDQFTVSTDSCAKSGKNCNLIRNRKMSNSPKIPVCDRSRSAVIDVVILIAVIGACGVLLFPYIRFIAINLIEISDVVFYVLKEEVSNAPLMYGSIGVSICCATLAAWGILMCTTRKCSKPNCKGLRKAAEFDIQLETEECVKNSNSSVNVKDGVKIGLFELPCDHHRELEMELKKMAPPNGRAVLVFRARCGCSMGRMEVPGPKKYRKVKKQK